MGVGVRIMKNSKLIQHKLDVSKNDMISDRNIKYVYLHYYRVCQSEMVEITKNIKMPFLDKFITTIGPL